MESRPWSCPSDSTWQRALGVVKHLVDAGHQAVFVGGCVRDHLLGHAVADIDIATSADPDAVAARFPDTVPVGRAFGVMIVVVDGVGIEVASFRSDEAYIDGRRPTAVRPASEADDVWRRDFTCNALVADPQAGELRDHVGGLADLENRLLRVVGDARARLAEDRLRVLRGYRFAARLDLTIERATAHALQATDPSGLARERLWDEWVKALAHPSRGRWLASLAEHPQALGAICPHLARDRVPELVHQFGRLPAAATTCEAEALCFAMAGPGLLPWLAGEPRSRQDRRRLERLVMWLQGDRPDPQDAVAWQRLCHDPLAPALQHCLVARGDRQAARLGQDIAAARQRGPMPRLVDGADLHDLGVRPGPDFARILRAVEDAWLLGTCNDREQGLALAARLIDRDRHRN